MEFNNICIISYFVYRGTRLSHPHFRYFRDKSNGASQPHFLHFSTGKAAISLMDKVPMSPQQRFSRFSTWIRELDQQSHPFSYFRDKVPRLLEERFSCLVEAVSYDISVPMIQNKDQ